MKIKMLKTVSGAPDGLTTLVYRKDVIYPTSTHPLTDFLYDVFVNQLKAAVDYVPAPEFVRRQEKMEQKMERAAPQNKAIKSAPSNKKLTRNDFKGLSAKEIRKLAKEAGVDLKDKPFNTSAEKLVEVFFMRQ